MHQKTDSCGQSDAVNPAGCGVPAASFITIPRLVLPTELYSQGNLSRILPILHGIGQYTDLEPLLKNDYSPLSVLKKALQQWFAGMLPKEIEQSLDFEVDFITEPDNQGCSDLEFDSDEDDYVLLFRLGSPYASDFTVEKAILRYEAEFPGLGQKILRKISTATPFDIGTPQLFLNVVRDNCWNSYEDEKEYIDEICSCEDEETCRMYLDEMDVTRADFDENFEPWMLQPDETVFQGSIPPELEELFQLPYRKYIHTKYPCCNTSLPGILIWHNSMIFDCFDNIYDQAANEGRDIILNGLYWTFPKDNAHLEKTLEEISHAVQSLSRFYKLTLSRKKGISTIARELEHVTIYVQLQNMRYHDSIELITDIPDELSEYQIPKLTLQPVVENSILHGILEKESKSGTIVITGWMENKDIVLLISDDGVGISPEILSTILSGSGNSQSGGTNIAVYNTHRRLQILYGKDYGLTYSSNPGKGTEVEIRFPAHREE